MQKNKKEVKQTKVEVVAVQQQKPIKKCNRCGAMLQDDDTLCPKCLAPTEWQN